MHRKILGLCTALVAVGALVIAPTAALAATHLSDSGTEEIPAGKLIKAIGGNVSEFSGSGLSVKCNENYLTGKVFKETNPVEGTITFGAFDSNLTTAPTDCESNIGNTRVTLPGLEKEGAEKEPWCLESGGATDTFKFYGRDCGIEGNGTLTFILDVTGLSNCPFVRNAPVSGEYKTSTTGTEELSVTGAPEFTREGNNILCPSKGFITKMQFGLYTDTESTSSTQAEKTNNWDRTADTEDPVKITP